MRLSPYKFFIPGFYLFISRLKTVPEKISWVAVNPIPIFVVSCIVSDGLAFIFPLPFLFCFAAGFLAWQSMYEVGYLQNDAFTIDRELTPTLRVSEDAVAYIRLNFYRILLVRLVITACLVWAMCAISYEYGLPVNLKDYIAVLIVGACSFVCHNSIRSRANIITYFFLSCSKYLALPVLFFLEGNFLLFMLVVVMVFPFIRTLEHGRKNKYRLFLLRKLFKDVDFARVIYYFLGGAIFALLCFEYGGEEFFLGFVVFCYFFIFRVFAFIFSRFFKRGIPEAYK